MRIFKFTDILEPPYFGFFHTFTSQPMGLQQSMIKIYGNIPAICYVQLERRFIIEFPQCNLIILFNSIYLLQRKVDIKWLKWLWYIKPHLIIFCWTETWKYKICDALKINWFFVPSEKETNSYDKNSLKMCKQISLSTCN